MRAPMRHATRSESYTSSSFVIIYVHSGAPAKFKKMVEDIRRVEQMLGNGKILPSREEIMNRKYYHRFLVTKKNIRKGEYFSWDNLILKRVGHVNKGISSKAIEYIFKKKSKIKITKDTVLNNNHF